MRDAGIALAGMSQQQQQQQPQPQRRQLVIGCLVSAGTPAGDLVTAAMELAVEHLTPPASPAPLALYFANASAADAFQAEAAGEPGGGGCAADAFQAEAAGERTGRLPPSLPLPPSLSFPLSPVLRSAPPLSARIPIAALDLLLGTPPPSVLLGPSTSLQTSVVGPIASAMQACAARSLAPSPPCLLD
ncbi:unnamed protein product [Closterium sp. NIES-53]